MEQQPQPGLGPFQAPQIGEAQRRFWLIVDAMIAALVVLVLVGGWTYLQVRGSLRDLRSAGLVSLVEVEARAVSLWIEEKTRDAERWAATPEVRREGARLAALPAPAACAAGAQRSFREAIAPYAALEEFSAFNLVARGGQIVSSQLPRNCGVSVSEAFQRDLSPVFEGRSAFVGPRREAERLGGPAPEGADVPFVWIATPVRADDGAIVAALGFGRPAAQRFEGLLALTASGTTRDAFALDEGGRMITQARYRPEAGSALAEPTALTRAVLARDASQGVLLEPYRSYRGAQVIGAWRWLPDARLAVAVEVEAAEAYEPLEYLQVAFGVLFVLVLLSMTAAASTSLWAMRMRLREAKRVGAYRIERSIGEGGMSDVYLAHHDQLKRVAAVKILKAHLATDEAVTRFRREAQLCSQLSHPNTVEIYDYGTTRDGRWYYAMEYLEGIPLEELVRRYGPMPVPRAVHALRQACGSLAEAHARGWVHRDVKPSNLMLCARGGQHDVLKVVDFGLIKQPHGVQTRDITQYSRVLGTPLYMAPERLRDPADADARSDIYAIGAVAYFILCGQAAFAAETEHDTLYKVMNEPAPPLGDCAAAPAALADIIARCLAKDRALRPADVAELEAVLDAVAREHPWTELEARAWWGEHPEALGAAPGP